MSELAWQEKTPQPPTLPWMAWKVGERVVVRRREADGFYDAVGDLIEVSYDHVVVATRRGNVRIPAEKMVIGKRILSPPQR